MFRTSSNDIAAGQGNSSDQVTYQNIDQYTASFTEENLHTKQKNYYSEHNGKPVNLHKGNHIKFTRLYLIN